MPDTTVKALETSYWFCPRFCFLGRSTQRAASISTWPVVSPACRGACLSRAVPHCTHNMVFPSQTIRLRKLKMKIENDFNGFDSQEAVPPSWLAECMGDGQLVGLEGRLIDLWMDSDAYVETCGQMGICWSNSHGWQLSAKSIVCLVSEVCERANIACAGFLGENWKN